MDKLNLHGLPARRLVWVDADMLIRENVDELCELPRDIRLAAAINAAGGRPTYIWLGGCHVPSRPRDARSAPGWCTIRYVRVVCWWLRV